MKILSPFSQPDFTDFVPAPSGCVARRSKETGTGFDSMACFWQETSATKAAQTIINAFFMFCPPCLPVFFFAKTIEFAAEADDALAAQLQGLGYRSFIQILDFHTGMIVYLIGRYTNIVFFEKNQKKTPGAGMSEGLFYIENVAYEVVEVRLNGRAVVTCTRD